jgi:tRNA(Ile2) C34 agmatinyltransferase TiaS
LEAKCPRCDGKGEFDPSTQAFRCPNCGVSLAFEEYVEEFARINDEKALDYAGKGNPTP